MRADSGLRLEALPVSGEGRFPPREVAEAEGAALTPQQPLGRGRCPGLGVAEGQPCSWCLLVRPFDAHRLGPERAMEVRPEAGTRTPRARRGPGRQVSGGLSVHVAMTTPLYVAFQPLGVPGQPARSFLRTPPGRRLATQERDGSFRVETFNHGLFPPPSNKSLTTWKTMGRTVIAAPRPLETLFPGMSAPTPTSPFPQG